MRIHLHLAGKLSQERGHVGLVDDRWVERNCPPIEKIALELLEREGGATLLEAPPKYSLNALLVQPARLSEFGGHLGLALRRGTGTLWSQPPRLSEISLSGGHRGLALRRGTGTPATRACGEALACDCGLLSRASWVRAVGGVLYMAAWLFIVYFLYFYTFSSLHFLRGSSVSSTVLPVNVLT